MTFTELRKGESQGAVWGLNPLCHPRAPWDPQASEGERKFLLTHRMPILEKRELDWSGRFKSPMEKLLLSGGRKDRAGQTDGDRTEEHGLLQPPTEPPQRNLHDICHEGDPRPEARTSFLGLLLGVWRQGKTLPQTI